MLHKECNFLHLSMELILSPHFPISVFSEIQTKGKCLLDVELPKAEISKAEI